MQQGGQVLRCLHGFGNGVQRGLLCLRLFQQGNVARHRHAQLVGGGPAGRPHDVRQAAILAQVAVFKMRLRMAIHDGTRGGQGAGAVGGSDQVEHLLADHFLLRVAEDAFAGGADEDEAPVHVHHAHGVEQQIGETGDRRANHMFHMPTILVDIAGRY
ncbi:hypothetical protein D3C81_1794740 [compost metagenome]